MPETKTDKTDKRLMTLTRRERQILAYGLSLSLATCGARNIAIAADGDIVKEEELEQLFEIFMSSITNRSNG